MRTMNFLLIFGFFCAISCTKREVAVDSPPAQDPIIQMIWTTPIHNGLDVIGTDNTLFYKDWVLVTGDLSDPPTVIGFNKKTGEKEWEYIHEGELDNSIHTAYLQGNIYIGLNQSGLFAMNLDTRSLIWEVNLNAQGYLVNRGVLASNSKFYCGIDKYFHTSSQIKYLIEIDVATGVYSTIKSWPTDSQGSYSIGPPVLWTDNQTQKSYFFLNEYYDVTKSTNEMFQDIVAIDQETRTVAWRNSKFTENYPTNGGRPPALYNDIVITGGDWSIYGFNARTGEKLWRTPMPGYTQWGIFTNTNHLIHDGRLYVNPGGNSISCLDPNTGAFLWYNANDAPNCSDNMVYYEKEDLLVFTSWGYGSVMVLDALTGKTLHKEKPKDNSTYNNDVVYDPETDMFFTSTYKSVVGFKVKRPK